MSGSLRRLAEILERALDGQPPAGLDIATLLAVTDPDDAAALFAEAGELRHRHFGGSGHRLDVHAVHLHAGNAPGRAVPPAPTSRTFWVVVPARRRC